MSPNSTRKSTRICKRRKLNDDDLRVRLDVNKRVQEEMTHSNKSGISSDGILSSDNSSECSSSNATAKLFENCSSSRDICISTLTNHGLIRNRKEEIDRINNSYYNGIRPLKCKSCAAVGQSSKMLICDNCEGPFHLKCSGMVLRKVLPEEWYCHPCSGNKRRRTLGKASLESKNSKEKGEELKREKIPEYSSSVRIGDAFQADVQEWFGPMQDDDGYHEELEEIRPGELGHLNVPKVNKTYSYCNWIQCKEENKGTVCGKWRRAPFFETQTDNWDCSCSVLWDPSYADCAVPQLRHRLAQKETSQQAIQ